MESIYDRYGLELWEKFIAGAGSFNTEQLKLLSEALKDSTKVLDLGIGLGNLAKILVSQGKIVYGVDIRRDSLDYAQRKVGSEGLGKLVLVEKDVRDLNFNNEFDGASIVSNVADFGDLNPIFSGVYRALQNNGYFAMTGVESNHLEKMTELRGKETELAIQEGILFFTPDEVKKLQKEGKNLEKMKEGLSKVIDSSERTTDALIRNGFKVLRKQEFYHDTCYFVLAQK